MIEFDDKTLFWDLETHSLTERYDHTPRTYVRLMGYTWGESDEVHITDDYDEMLELVRSAETVIGHNQHGFDLSVLFGVDSVEPLEMAFENRVFDTLTHATLVNPAPYKYTPRGGKKPLICDSPDKARKWFGLDNQAYQLGTPGKLLDLTALVQPYEYDSEPVLKKDGTPGKRVLLTRKPDVCCGYGTIPLDHPEFREYLRDDVRATRYVARALLEIRPLEVYDWEAQQFAAVDAQITRNGVRVDIPATDALVFEQLWDAAHILDWLHEQFEFPIHRKDPMKTLDGKAAIRNALASHGIPSEALARTDTGADSFSGDSIKTACGYVSDGKGLVPGPSTTPVTQELAEALATLAGQRSMPQLTRDSVMSDGKVHPEIMALQRSGRKSVTKPGLTVFDNRYKALYIPDFPNHRNVEFDYSNADARVVAALSGDRAFAVRFEPGQDGHRINALAVWSQEEYDSDPEFYRNKMSKRMGHAWGYVVGPTTLSQTTGIPVEVCRKFLKGLSAAFPGVTSWQRRVAAAARRTGYVRNLWGRRMPVEPGREPTQAPALEGQGGTTEIMNRGFIRLPIRVIRMIKIPIHDAALFSIPVDELEETCKLIEKALYAVLDPPGGQRIEFPVGRGAPGMNWLGAVH